MPEARFISTQHLPRLSKTLGDGKAGGAVLGGREDALRGLAGEFVNPRFLARTYIQPHCQSADPAEVEDQEPDGGASDASPAGKLPLFSAVDDFLEGERTRGRHLFVLGDTGMGKTSLLVMLKLVQLAGLWPKHYRCELLKIGADTLAQVEKIKSPRKTVLLLDALDEEPGAAAQVATRIAELLRVTAGFHRVIITCRTQYRPDGRRDQFGTVAMLAGAGHQCPTLYLSRFNGSQIDRYLKRRFTRMEEPTRKRAKIVLDGLGSLKTCPLVLSVVDDFVHSRCKAWTEFSIYEMMISSWLDREQRKFVEDKTGAAAFDRDLLSAACVKIARLTALAGSGAGVSAADLAAAQLPEPELRQLALLDARGSSFLLRDTAGSHRFSHPSIQDFLIALGLRSGVLSSGKKRIPANSQLIALLLSGGCTAIEWRALDLSFASLAGVEFQDADFSRALLASADLSGAVFARTSFDNADLKFCEARGTKFFDCDFKATNAAHTAAASAVVERCRLTQASFAGTVLPGARFEGCTIENTSFADADLSDAAFTKCRLAHCNFTATQLSGARFHDCTLDGLKFDRGSLVGATFTDTTTVDVSLLSTDLRGARLDGQFHGSVTSGALKNWQDAAWDPDIAKLLRLPQERNAKNAASIDRDTMR